MKKITTFCILVGFSSFALAQTAPTATNSLSASLATSVFPADGQTPEQQSKDEAECYQWGVTNTGIDPFKAATDAKAAEEAANAASQQAAAAGQGAGVKGAVGGAAAGAIIGEIADDDASQGAAVGAAVGAVAARRGAKKAQAQAQQTAQQTTASAQQLSAEQTKTFKNAFAACLEGKKYIAKF